MSITFTFGKRKDAILHNYWVICRQLTLVNVCCSGRFTVRILCWRCLRYILHPNTSKPGTGRQWNKADIHRKKGKKTWSLGNLRFSRAKMLSVVFWLMKPCSLIGSYKNFLISAASIFSVLRNVGNHLQGYTTSQPRRTQYTVLFTRKLKESVSIRMKNRNQRSLGVAFP